MILDEKSSYLKSALDTMMEGPMLIDTNGTIGSVNRAMGSITAYSKKGSSGK